MKIQIGVEPGTSYYFTPPDGSSGHITISGVNVTKSNILAIINMTKGIVAMQCNSAIPEYSIDESLNRITLLSTGAATFEASDTFLILMEVPSSKKDDNLLESVQLLRQMVSLLESQGNVDSSNRQRVAVEAIPTTTVTIATTGGANVTGIGYPVSNACTVGGVTPYAITASQPAQLVATIIDQRISLEIDMHVAHDTMRSKLSWT